MNIKSCIKYQISEFASSTKKYYLIIFGFMFIISITAIMFNGKGSFSGIETISTTYIFILMLSVFREQFNMLMQNGISRKTLYLSSVITGPILAFVLIILDTVLFNVFNFIVDGDSGQFMSNFFEQVYPDRYASASFIQKTFETILLMGIINTFVMSAGYMLAAIYYRLSKLVKIIVFTGVPALFIMSFPIDAYIFKGHLSDAFIKIIDFSFGAGTDNPYIPMLTLIIISVILFGLSWLAIRRAPLKEK